VLPDEFEAEYDTPTYEAKVSNLLHRAYARVKEENPETARTWNESIRILRRATITFWSYGTNPRKSGHLRIS
jgi:hypothetical protein